MQTKPLKIILVLLLVICVAVPGLWYGYLKLVQKNIYSFAAQNTEMFSIKKMNLSATLSQQKHVVSGLKIFVEGKDYLFFEEVEIINNLFDRDQHLNFTQPIYYVHMKRNKSPKIMRIKPSDDTKISFRLSGKTITKLDIASSGVKIFNDKHKEIYSADASGFTLLYDYGNEIIFDLRHGPLTTKSITGDNSYAESGNIYFKTSTKDGDTTTSFADFYVNSKDYSYIKSEKNNLLILGKVRIKKSLEMPDFTKLSGDFINNNGAGFGNNNEMASLLKSIKSVDLVIKNFDFVNSNYAIKFSGSIGVKDDLTTKISTRLILNNVKNIEEGVLDIATLIGIIEGQGSDYDRSRIIASKQVGKFFGVAKSVAARNTNSNINNYVYDITSQGSNLDLQVNGYPVLNLLLMMP